LRNFGHRCALELDFSLPRWKEDPTFVINILKNYLSAPESSNPSVKIKKTKQHYFDNLKQVKNTLPKWKFWIFKYFLKKTQSFQKFRENMKSDLVKHLFQIRILLLKIGEILKGNGIFSSPEDIFLLHQNELLKMSDGTISITSFTSIIKERKEKYKTYKSLKLPKIITDVDNIPESEPAETAPHDSTLKGTGVSHGKIEGIARVINSIDEISRIKPGEILVTDHTDPGWTLIFPTVKGIITNTGGLLSHAAIIAREYGLPAVVNVKNATKIIPDGQKIMLNGDNGIIILK